MSTTAVIVGASVAGVRTAQALRAAGFDGRVVAVGNEPDPPYDKPPLSKQLLVAPGDPAPVPLLGADDDAQDIELRLGRAAEHVDLAGRRVRLTGGEHLDYDHLVIATGARARPSPWTCTPSPHVLRTLDDCRRLRADLHRGGDVVVVGGGFIGAEVAASARSLGLSVTIVDPMPVLMARALGAEIAERFTSLHHRHGTATRLGVGVEAIEGTAGDYRVLLTDGTTLPGATVVVGIGSVPNTEWLAGSGLDLDDGVVCDEYGRVAGARDVYAVGDVARSFHPRLHRHVRAEHWTSAVDQARSVAHTIVHPDDPRSHHGVEFVWSDQYDWRIQVLGRPAEAAKTQWVDHGDTLGGADQRDKMIALAADPTGLLSGAVVVNWPRAGVEARRALAAGADVTATLARIDALRAPRTG